MRKLIILCREKEVSSFARVINKSNIVATFVHTFDGNEAALCGQDLILVSALAWNQKIARAIGSLDAPPIIISLNTEMPIVPATALFGKIRYAPLIWDESIDYQLIQTQAAALQRKFRRANALRQHKSRGWDFEKNPALFLITNLVKECSLAETASDVLRAMLSLRTVLDFQFGALYILDENSIAVGGWQAFAKPAQRIQAIAKPPQLSWDTILDKNTSVILSPFESSFKNLSALGEPWSSGLAIRVVPTNISKKKSSFHSAVIVLFRNELIPFSEKESWLLELSLGPVTLALEKASVLESINDASHEWRTTFDAISEPITVVDEEFNIVKANKAFARVVHGDIKSIKGKKCFGLLAGKRSPCERCPIVLSTESKLGVQIQGKQKNDFLVWSYNLRSQKQDFNFQFYRTLEKENQLRSALIQSEKMVALGKLVGSIAHEVNNPLAGILSTCQLLLDEPTTLDKGTLKDDVEEILSAAKRSKAIIANLLGFTEQGRAVEVLQIAPLIQNTLALCKSALKDIQLTINCSHDLPRIYGTASMFQQILFNLITNSIHAMSGAGSLEIAATRNAEIINISITDTGPGIDLERQKIIFDPFSSSKAEGQGTGLGLSIVKNLTKRMNGEISVSSTPGKGTSFFLKFPTVSPDV